MLQDEKWTHGNEALAACRLDPQSVCADVWVKLSLDPIVGADHRAMIAVELEVLAKKLDRFGWERDRNSPAHDRLLMDWMAALQDYPLDEVRAACRAAVQDRPNAMPNEGHIVAKINEARGLFLRMNPPPPLPEPPRAKVTPERAAEIMAQAGFRPKTFGGDA
jgi:hypothetical protein